MDDYHYYCGGSHPRSYFESRWVHMKREPELWMVVVSLAIAAAFVTLMGFACAADVAYYQEHGVWWGTPPK
jgi:hypothetical protein